MMTILRYLIYIHVVKTITELIVRIYQVSTQMVADYESLPNLVKSIYSNADFESSRTYSVDKEFLKIIKVVYMDLILGTYELYYGIWGSVWLVSENLAYILGYCVSCETAPTTIFLFLICIFSTIKEFPINVLENFIVEDRLGAGRNRDDFMNQELRRLFHKLMFVPVVSTILHISVLKGHSNLLWLYLSFGLALIVGFFVYSIFIETICMETRLLEEGPLKSSIKDLLRTVNLEDADIYVASKTSKCSYRSVQIFGLSWFKKVVIYQDVMRSHLSEDEILAIICHELGHWEKGHIWIWLGVFQQIFLADILTSMLFLRCRCIFRAIGLSCSKTPVILALLLSKVFVSGSIFVSFVIKFMFRTFEYQADDYVKELGQGKVLAKALVKMSKEKKEFPKSAAMYMYGLLAKPTLLSRISALGVEKED